MQKQLTHSLTASQLVANWSGGVAQVNINSDLSEIAGVTNIPSIADVTVAFSNKTAIEVIANHLLSLCAFGDKQLKPTQFFDSAMLIATEYYFLNLSEVCLFFRRCKLGYYGQLVWGKELNIQQVMTALRLFIRDRYDAINKREESNTRATHSDPIHKQMANITVGVDKVRELNEKAKTDYGAFRELFPKTPSKRSPFVWWRAWRLKEQRIGKYLCEYNIRNK